MNTNDPISWMVSLHGGHSGEFCDHARGKLREILDAAVDRGFSTFGVSEHAPRLADRYLYEQEVEWGWTVEKIEQDFERYAAAVSALSDEYAGRLDVLRGYEIEVVPPDSYVKTMRGYREQFGFDYCVGSVHFMYDVSIDGPMEKFERAMAAAGGLEPLAIGYYELVAEMVDAIEPEVVGHLDLIRLNGRIHGPVDTPSIRSAALSTLEVIRDKRGILDLNTAGWRKGMDDPYPEPWLVAMACDMGVPFCFGDDSHSPEQVGDGIARARDYLLANGVESVACLRRIDGKIGQEQVSLQ